MLELIPSDWSKKTEIENELSINSVGFSFDALY
jgi:hypothetical protein